MIDLAKKRIFFTLNTPSGRLAYKSENNQQIEVEKISGKLAGIYVHEFTCQVENPENEQDNMVFVKQIRLILEDNAEQYVIPIGLKTYLATNCLNSLLTLAHGETEPWLTLVVYRTKDRSTGQLNKFIKLKIIHSGTTLKWKYGLDEISGFGSAREDINMNLFTEFSLRFGKNFTGGENE